MRNDNIISYIREQYKNEYKEFLKTHKESQLEYSAYIKLRSISRLVGKNLIEFLRIQDNNVIVSEIKSQFGPEPDFKIELESNQLEMYTRLTNLGINTSLIYYIAFPKPNFIEISFLKLYGKFFKFQWLEW